MYDELIDALRYCLSDDYVKRGCCWCPINKDGMVCGTQDDAIKYAADAIERLQSELTEANGLIERLTAETEHWKQAWWSAYKLYEEGKRKPYEPKRPN